jgi:hypothetical protein
MKIEYKIEEVEPNVYAVIVPDNYHRPMLFCRVQEFYESPNPKFRGKNFSMWDFIEWYSRQKRDAFTYAFDWGGFNIPLEVAWKCYEGKNGVRIMSDGYKSPYDNVMTDIISDIQTRMFDKNKQRNLNAYIIGVADTEGWTFKHEVCHGLYYTNKKYRELVDEVTQTIPLKDYIKFKQNLIKMGYADSVVNDEIQAYLNFGHDWPAFTKGVSKRLCNNLHKTYQSIYNNTSITN